MDETSAIFTRSFKAVVPDGVTPLTESIHETGNMTAVFCFNAAGWGPKLYFILKNLKTMPKELMTFTENGVFEDQKSGWMTRNLFFHWCVDFVHELTYYRLQLPGHLRTQRITLITDGHCSRSNISALSYLSNNGVDLVVLPAHKAHVMQPFDVCMSAPFKSHVSQ